MIDHKKALAAAARQAATKAVKDYKNSNPEASRLGVFMSVGAYKRRPKGFTVVRAVSLFLADKSSLQKSNAEIAAWLGQDFPGYKVPANILTIPFGATDRKALVKLLKDRGVKLDLDLLDTPSKIKAHLAGVSASQDAASKFEGQVSFSDDAVVVGARRYPIQRENGYERIHVGKQKLRVDVLRLLLCENPL